jgi:hypothetical protein
MSRFRTLLALCCALATGCRVMDAPQGFVTLPARDDVRFAAVAASGNRLRVRAHGNQQGGSLEFWSAAVERELVQGRGYQKVATQALARASGTAGVELLFQAGTGPSGSLYLVVLFVDGGWLQVAEAGGEMGTFTAELPAIRVALATLREPGY